ncbi:hypothetical protein FKV23_12785 [Lysobacter alkalisoli]|uniref:Uncharacterized protein n=2 Tax=Marilutibacter alkalisoli TaxID=2591633 RepID=A0A514BU15_9GAMM|nr:hypothetical protein FKV23_12785 [Lysobacter alkalisoli]
MAARQRLPRGVRRFDRRPTRPASDTSRAGLAQAMAALYGPATGITHEQAMAERAQWAEEDDARRTRQGALPLREVGR